MRILHIDTGRQMRGGQWQALRLVQGLVERSIDCELLTPESGALFKAAGSLRLPVRPLHPYAIPFIDGSISLIHAHDARAHTIALLSRRPLVVGRRVGFPVQRSPLSKFKYRRATHFIAVSEYVKRLLIEAGMDEQRISVVYDGVRVPERDPTAHRHLVVALDSRDPGKGKSIVAKAARLAEVKIHFSTHLLRDLREALLFVYISEMEGLGSAALMAMAHGAAVLASRVGGLPEIVDDGITGVLTDNDPALVAAALRRLVSDRPFMNRLAMRGRSQVEREFTIDHMVDNTIRVYRKVLARD